MFSKTSKSNGRDRDVVAKDVPSIISSDLAVTGDLVSAGEIQIDGTVEGDIRCKALVIGVNGEVTGEIDADSVRLHGRVTGQLRAKTVFLAATARMVGDIAHESLAIEPGAFMEGHCRRMPDPAKLSEIGEGADTPVAMIDTDATQAGEDYASTPDRAEAVAG